MGEVGLSHNEIAKQSMKVGALLFFNRLKIKIEMLLELLGYLQQNNDKANNNRVIE